MADPGHRADPAAGGRSFRLFVNYRRADAPIHVGRLFDALRYGRPGQPGFDEDQIFMDIDTIEPGADYRDVIRDAVAKSDVFICVIGTQWLTHSGTTRPRLEDAADWVRVEIEAALARSAEQHDIRLVPTRVNGAEMPTAEDLPATLADLAHRQAVELTNDRWDYDVTRFLTWLKRLEQEKRERILAAEQAAEAEAREREAKREREEAERAKREEAERAKREEAERAKREEAERAKREEAERAKREEAERAKRDETERAKREEAEREAAERAEREAEQPKREAEAAERERRARETAGRRRRLRRAAGAAVVAAVLAGVVVAILSAGGEPRGGALSWTRVRSPELRGSGDRAMTSLSDTPSGGLVAGGFDASAGDRDAAWWSSGAGRGWHLTSRPESGNQTVASIARYRGELVAAGTNDAAGDDDLALWRSTDGTDWETVGVAVAIGAREIVSRLANTRTAGLLAAGWTIRGSDLDASVWVLRAPGGALDGSPAPAGDPDLGGRGRQRIDKIVEPRSGELVAVGAAGGDAAVWRSGDGRNWERVEGGGLGGHGSQNIRDATNADGRIVAVGSAIVQGRETGAAWVSEDGGTRWSRVGDPAGAVPVRVNRVFHVQDEAADGLPAFIAVGSAGGDAAAWTSDDGRSWKAEPNADDVFGGSGPQDLRAVRATRLPAVAVGSSGPDGDRVAAAWTATLPD